MENWKMIWVRTVERDGERLPLTNHARRTMGILLDLHNKIALLMQYNATVSVLVQLDP